MQLHDLGRRFPVLEFDDQYLVEGKHRIRQAVLMGQVSPNALGGGLGACLLKLAWLETASDLEMVEKVLVEIDEELGHLEVDQATLDLVGLSSFWIRARALNRAGQYEKSMQLLEKGMEFAFNAAIPNVENKDVGMEMLLMALTLRTEHRYLLTQGGQRVLANTLLWLGSQEYRPVPEKRAWLQRRVEEYLDAYAGLQVRKSYCSFLLAYSMTSRDQTDWKKFVSAESDLWKSMLAENVSMDELKDRIAQSIAVQNTNWSPEYQQRMTDQIVGRSWQFFSVSGPSCPRIVRP